MLSFNVESQDPDTIEIGNFLTTPYSRLSRNFIEAELRAGRAARLTAEVTDTAVRIRAGTYSGSDRDFEALVSNLWTVTGTAEALIIEGLNFDPFDESEQAAIQIDLQQETAAAIAAIGPDEEFTEEPDFYEPIPEERGYQELKKDLIEAALDALEAVRETRGSI